MAALETRTPGGVESRSVGGSCARGRAEAGNAFVPHVVLPPGAASDQEKQPHLSAVGGSLYLSGKNESSQKGIPRSALKQ